MKLAMFIKLIHMRQKPMKWKNGASERVPSFLGGLVVFTSVLLELEVMRGPLVSSRNHSISEITGSLYVGEKTIAHLK
jgi:hypothetical protein